MNCEYVYEDENILEADAVLFYLHKVWISCSLNLDRLLVELDKSEACPRTGNSFQENRPALGVS